MADNLFGASAGLLESAGQKQTQNMEIAQKPITQATDASNTARQNQVSAQDAQKLAMLKSQLDQAENMIDITPQIALGLVKNTGDKEWMKAIGQKMRADVVMAMYTHGINTKISQKEITTMIGKNKVTLQPYIDDDGQLAVKQIASDEGTTTDIKKEEADAKKKKAEADATKASGSTKKASGSTKMDPADVEFMKDFRTAKKNTSGINDVMLQALAKKDPKQAADRQKDLDFVTNNQARYDKLEKLNPQKAASGTPQDGGQLPPQAMKAVQDANGQPVTFQNGQTWQMKDGKPVQISG
jgi:hypothetical protein